MSIQICIVEIFCTVFITRIFFSYNLSYLKIGFFKGKFPLAGHMLVGFWLDCPETPGIYL